MEEIISRIKDNYNNYSEQEIRDELYNIGWALYALFRGKTEKQNCEFIKLNNDNMKKICDNIDTLLRCLKSSTHEYALFEAYYFMKNYKVYLT